MFFELVGMIICFTVLLVLCSVAVCLLLSLFIVLFSKLSEKVTGLVKMKSFVNLFEPDEDARETVISGLTGNKDRTLMISPLLALGRHMGICFIWNKKNKE